MDGTGAWRLVPLQEMRDSHTLKNSPLSSWQIPWVLQRRAFVQLSYPWGIDSWEDVCPGEGHVLWQSSTEEASHAEAERFVLRCCMFVVHFFVYGGVFQIYEVAWGGCQRTAVGPR